MSAMNCMICPMYSLSKDSWSSLRALSRLTGSIVATRWMHRGDWVTIKLDGLGTALVEFAAPIPFVPLSCRIGSAGTLITLTMLLA